MRPEELIKFDKYTSVCYTAFIDDSPDGCHFLESNPKLYMALSPIQAAIQQICQEKNISEASVMRTIELALAAAFRKDFGNKLQNIVTEFDAVTGAVNVFDVKTVVEDVPEELLAQMNEDGELLPTAIPQQTEHTAGAYSAGEEEGEAVRKFNPRTELQLKDALLVDPKHAIGDEIITPLEVPGEFGRMAAQTAKQVIIQKIREEERQNIFDEYKTMEHQMINGTIQRREGRAILVDLGHTTAILPPEEQIERERYAVGNRMKFYLKAVEQSTRGPQLVLSRAHTEMVRKVFETEIPEVASGAIEIKSIAREAGSRSKVAIMSHDENIDPIGSCVGQRGTRIQTIIAELGNEKVDIILWDANPVAFITNALSPAKVQAVELREDTAEKIAKVIVAEDQLSLAIGRAGQNVRLASRLTGWKIDIASSGVSSVVAEEGAEAPDSAEETPTAEVVEETPEEVTETSIEETKE